MKRWLCDRPATFEVIWRNMMWHGVTWHDGARCDMTWHYVIWHDVTWRGMTWHKVYHFGMTWHDVAWRDMTWHDVTWRKMTWHNATWHDATWRLATDVSGRVILISTQQEWTLLHVRWLRYCQKTIKTFLGLNLFTDIYTLCSCIDESQKDEKVEAHQNWVGKIVLFRM